MHTCTHARTYIYTHACIHAHMHAHTHARTPQALKANPRFSLWVSRTVLQNLTQTFCPSTAARVRAAVACDSFPSVGGERLVSDGGSRLSDVPLVVRALVRTATETNNHMLRRGTPTLHMDREEVVKTIPVHFSGWPISAGGHPSQAQHYDQTRSLYFCPSEHCMSRRYVHSHFNNANM